ncbi:sigma factor-like helix-turn-helix DNA-binding protein [Streptomyces narbonensis]|uniref:sigma factor-like helix-turn-helix DNA-binding protein n=1 Tax=Streptomyces narbonensis TaxID=67333 RepID=UPI00167B8598|nr:sigma factor-like helix-turn-helix DNA-binding protein [Streptomyces narbonensis]GGW01048.1 DNA-directed RNA polymerase sigma-70 factor [Streptomyces narbonensis]
MDDDDALAGRSRLEAVAYRMLGSADEAGEAVDEALRESERLATVGGRPLDTLARICLERLRARETHRTAPWDPWDPWDTPAERPGPGTTPTGPPDPALLAALEALTPPERLAFVLHDLFDVPYEEIAPVLERTPAAARQLAARARHRVRGTEEMPEPDPARQRETVAAFLAAARDGDSEALLALLDPDVALRADPTAVRAGMRTAHGAGTVALALAGPIREARQALVDGAAGLVLTRGGRPDTVFAFTVLEGRITSVDVLADEGHLGRLTVRPLTENSNTAP